MIYIIKCTNGTNTYIKLGYTTNLKKRITQYEDHNPFVELLYAFDFKNNLYFEKYFHLTHKAVYRREWYDITMLDTILDNIELFQKNSALQSELMSIHNPKKNNKKY